MSKKTNADLQVERALALLDRFETVDRFVTFWRAVGSWPMDGPGVERLQNWDVV